MNAILFALAGFPVTVAAALQAMVAALAILMLLALFGHVAASRARGDMRRREREQQAMFAALARSGAELHGRLQGVAETLGGRQTDFARLFSDRIDDFGRRVGQGMEAQTERTGSDLGRLNERLAVIDAAQSRLKSLSEEIVSLSRIFSDKQARGIFGQGRMETIVRDGLPAGGYEFQATLSNRSRPDCIVRLPGDPRPLVIDAKFPLEAFTAFREARDGDARKAAEQRVRAHVGKHIKDVADKYLLSGETQDVALLFIPSESIYCDLIEHFDDALRRAHAARIVLVSPSLLMMAIQVLQALTRDARMRDEAHVVQAEVGKLLRDVRLLAERASKLETHFRQAQDDVGGLLTSADRITRRGGRIEAMDIAADATREPDPPQLRLAEG